MSAALMANVQAASCSRRSFLTVFRKVVSDSAAMSIIGGCRSCGGMSNVSARVGWVAQIVVHRGETKSMEYFSQSMVGLWWCSQGIPKTKGWWPSLVT